MDINQELAPAEIILRKLTAQEKTQPGDVMLFNKQFFPLSSYGVNASEFDAVIYRQKEEE